MTSCNADDSPHVDRFDVPSSCDNFGDESAYTCFSMAPRAIDEQLSYGYAAVPANGDVCGRCYELTFDGTGHYHPQDPGSQLIRAKRLIVQATNIGHDVAGRQFDLLIPGGGVGLFHACTRQWGLPDNTDLDAHYGGFLTVCRHAQPDVDHDDTRGCVRARCDTVFAAPHLSELRAGCHWFIDWFHIAGHPNLEYREVNCPADLVSDLGVDRRPLNDVSACGPGGAENGGGDRRQCECDCEWTNERTLCGVEDGTCCCWSCCGTERSPRRRSFMTQKMSVPGPNSVVSFG